MVRQIGQYFRTRYFKAADLATPRLLTIASASEEEVGLDNARKLVVRFEQEEQGLVLNLTNARTISEIAATDDLDAWPGTQIVLFATQTDFAGRLVDCIRCRAPKNGAARGGGNRGYPAEPAPAKHQQQTQDESVDEDDDCPF